MEVKVNYNLVLTDCYTVLREKKIQVQLLIYFMLKYAMEILLAESSVVTTYYFNWDTSIVAIFLAILGITVLPVNAAIGSYISNMFEDRYVKFLLSCVKKKKKSFLLSAISIVYIYTFFFNYAGKYC